MLPLLSSCPKDGENIYYCNISTNVSTAFSEIHIVNRVQATFLNLLGSPTERSVFSSSFDCWVLSRHVTQLLVDT